MPTYLYPDGIARLGAARTGLAGSLGYRLDAAAGDPVVAWTKAGVVETDVPGTYAVVLGGVEGMPVPKGFTGTITWSTTADPDDPGLASEELWPGKYEYVDVAISSRMPYAAFEPQAAFVDHDWPTPDAMRVQDDSGVGIAGASIQVYRRADYDAGSRTRDNLIGSTSTGADGKWLAPLPMGPGDYAAIVGAAGFFSGLRYFTVA
jgi:hypothetical protein